MSPSGLEPGPAASGEYHVPTRPAGPNHAKPPAPLSTPPPRFLLAHPFLMSGQRGSKICDREQLRNISHFKVSFNWGALMRNLTRGEVSRMGD